MSSEVQAIFERVREVLALRSTRELGAQGRAMELELDLYKSILKSIALGTCENPGASARAALAAGRVP